MTADELGTNLSRRPGIMEAHSIETNGLTWMAVHGTLCLGLRHPSFEGATRAIVLNFVRALGEQLVEWGVLTAAELEAVERVEKQESPHGGA